MHWDYLTERFLHTLQACTSNYMKFQETTSLRYFTPAFIYQFSRCDDQDCFPFLNLDSLIIILVLTFFKVFYRPDIQKPAEEKQLQRCSSNPCRFEDFMKSMDPFILDEKQWAAECQD